MKRFLGILSCLIVFSACDDGDLVVDTINFDEVPTSTCSENNLLFKLKEGEALILNVPETTFTEEPTDVDDPIKLDIDPNGQNQVVYNFYTGKVSTKNICDLIPPSTPSIKTQWKAASGVIEITTEAVKKVNADESTRITGYKNSIVFKNITFEKEDKTTQFYETFTFGEYVKPVENSLPFAFLGVLEICSSGQLYEHSGGESLTLNIDPALIANEVTPPNQPRKGKIGLVTNKLVYRYYNSVVPPEYFCQPTDPLLPTIKEEWLGKAGGDIEVTTTTDGPNTFKHTIILRNVTMEKGTSNFELGNNYKYGELIK